MSAITFERRNRPALRSQIVLWSAVAAVAAAPILSATGGLTAEAFAEDGNQTLRAAGYAFSIWGLIYVGLLAYGAWQAFRHTPETTALRAVAWPSVIAMLGCAAWLVAAAYDQKLLTVVVILGSAAAMIVGLLKAAPHWPDLGAAGRFFIFWPLGLLAGWLTIASAINVLTVATTYGLVTTGSASTAGLIGIAAVLAVGSVVVWRLKHLAYGLPISWGLVAVWAAERGDKPVVAMTALGAAAFMLLIAGIAGRPGRH